MSAFPAAPLRAALSARPALSALPVRAPQRVLVVSGSVGAGHDGAASELARRLRERGVEVDVRDYMVALPRLTSFLLRDGYTLSVGKAPAAFQWLFDGIEARPTMQRWLDALCGSADATLLGWTREHDYGVVVSTYPMASQSLGHLRASGQLQAPAVTYLTDPAVHHGWVHPAVDHHLTVSPATARQGSADYGVTMRAAGPLVPPRFAADACPRRRAALRAELGIAPDARVALLVTGSLGLGDVGHSAARVLDAGLVPLVLCGRNAGLRRRLRAIPGVVALGWRDDVHELMQAVDVLVHNAGGLSFTEALVADLPAVTYRCIPGHGRANAAVLESARLAPWARTDEELAPVLREQAARSRSPRRHDDPADRVLEILDAAVARRSERRRGAPTLGLPKPPLALVR